MIPNLELFPLGRESSGRVQLQNFQVSTCHNTWQSGTNTSVCPKLFSAQLYCCRPREFHECLVQHYVPEKLVSDIFHKIEVDHLMWWKKVGTNGLKFYQMQIKSEIILTEVFLIFLPCKAFYVLTRHDQECIQIVIIQQLSYIYFNLPISFEFEYKTVCFFITKI